MENLLLPSKVEWQEGTAPHSGTAIVSPCFHGYGTTLGNGLRRVLLSSLEGAAVEAFKIKGAQHEFSAAEGVKEDVLEVMLNLKQLAVRVYTDEPVVLTLSKKGPGLIKAGDFDANSNAEILNKDLVIANLTTNKPFEMELVLGKGRGFRTVEEKDRKNYDLGMIVIDSIYTPIKDVGYKVEYMRVGNITNYEKLTLNIETNGTISPRDAMHQATQILMDHFSVILNSAGNESAEVAEKIVAPAEEEVVAEDSAVSEEETDEKTDKKKAAKAKKAKKK